MLIAFTAMLPPHVHPAAWGIALATAALMGTLATPRAGWRTGGSTATLALAGALLALNLWSSAQPLQSARTLALLAAYALVFVFCASLPHAGERSAAGGPAAPFGPIEKTLIAAGASLAVHGLYQSLHSFARIAAEQGEGLPEAVRARLESGRAVATLGLPGALGGLLALCLPIAVGWAVSLRSGAPRAAAALLVAVMIAGLAATRSAAPLICLAVASAAVAWSGATARNRTASRRAIAGGLLAAGLLGGSLLLAARLSGPSAIVEGSGPVALRAGNWLVAWRILADHPLVGAGLGCYGTVFPGYRAWGMNESRFAHNSYLQLLAEGGVLLGLMALMAAAALATRCLSSKDAAGRRQAGAWHSVACLAFLLHNALDFTLYIPTVGFAFFALAGAAARRRGPDRPAAASEGRALLAAASMLLAVFAVWTARADQVKQSALRLIEDGAPLVESTVLARAARRANPFDPEAASMLSRLLLEQGAPQRDRSMLHEAERHATRAVRLDPRTPGHWNHLGRVRLTRGDPIGAYIALHRAAELYPIQISYREERDAVARALERQARP